MAHSFITNRDSLLSDIITGILPKSDAVDILVGYFYSPILPKSSLTSISVFWSVLTSTHGFLTVFVSGMATHP